jgi:hypothetical protein
MNNRYLQQQLYIKKYLSGTSIGRAQTISILLTFIMSSVSFPINLGVKDNRGKIKISHLNSRLFYTMFNINYYAAMN